MDASTYIEKELQRFLVENHFNEILFTLEKPKVKKFGDISTNIALQLAGEKQENPRKIASDIINFIQKDPQFIEKVEIAGPGFINFYLPRAFLQMQINDILSQDFSYGSKNVGQGQKAQVEFISANPTGPLTIGHGRQAVLGDTISRLLQAMGFKVIREYYYNDAGRQMRILGDSVRLRYLQLLGDTIEFPEDYYQGEYITEIAQQIADTSGESRRDEINLSFFVEQAEKAVFKDIKKTIRRLKFDMDIFFNEKSLYDDGKIEEVITLLRNKELVEERDGALWFLTSKLGRDQDRVIVKSTGEPTYRLPDIAYHREKFERGFDIIIDLFGADHIDTYPDVLLGIQALGYDPEKVKVLIHQFVTLNAGTEKIKMSTRKANFVTLDELIDEVGVDVTRFFFLMRHMNSHLNFDLTLAKNQSDENPVYYVQYAHARICSILRLADEKQVTLGSNADFTFLDKEEEIELIKHLLDFPQILESSARQFEPHHLVNYLIECATLFHKFYTEHRVISEDQTATAARLSLCKATQIVLSNGCNLLGIDAPDKM